MAGLNAVRSAWIDQASFQKAAEQKANHIRGHAIREDAFAQGQPVTAFYRRLDERIRSLNEKGVVFDMVLGLDPNSVTRLFPSWQDRERYIRYMVARYSGFHVTWQVVSEFEGYENGRQLTKELGELIKKLDPYQHPRTAQALVTSSPLLADGWMDYILYQSTDDQLGAIEHQLYAVPSVNAGLVNRDKDSFRRHLWNAAMSGQYPSGSLEGGEASGVWFDFMSKTRYWEMEPYFDLTEGALALPGIEYIIYIEKPGGPVEVRVEKHGYDVKWFNPLTGESIPAKEFKAERYAAEPPDSTHDWVLHISREGKKEGMLRSYKFESQPFQMQEVENLPVKIPFEIVQPIKGEFAAKSQVKYAVKLKRDTRATRAMMYLWTGEIAANGLGFRILGTGSEGVLQTSLSGVMNVRVYGMNANGKVYATDRIFRVSH
ncbi:MAG: DUF4038 domain-containing protein [Bryobacteraceae bacterium]